MWVTVFYFEEREFRRRFPRATNPSKTPRDTGQKVTIPSKSGLSWKITEDEAKGSDLAKKGPHMSAVEANPAKQDMAQVQEGPTGTIAKEKTKAIEAAKSNTHKPADTLLTAREAASEQAPSKVEARPEPVIPAKVGPSPRTRCRFSARAHARAKTRLLCLHPPCHEPALANTLSQAC